MMLLVHLISLVTLLGLASADHLVSIPLSVPMMINPLTYLWYDP